jgi:hypothetical protein
MQSRLPRILSTDLFSPVAEVGHGALRNVADFVPPPFAEPRTIQPPSDKRRMPIWDLAKSLHCSIVGTCLSSGELRQLLTRLGIPGAETSSDHALHVQGVLLCGSREADGKFVQKALDRRHRGAINQFAKAKDTEAVRLLWAEALKRGDIPGAYWALLTHPATTEALAKQVFGEVHMLSHLIGAANRADIRRLRQLEEDNAALRVKLERQERQLRDGFTERDLTIRRLNDLLVHKMSQSPEPCAVAETAPKPDAFNSVVGQVSRRLAEETTRRERLECRTAVLAQAAQAARQARHLAESERDLLRQELASIELQVANLHEPEGAGSTLAIDLSRLMILYVGGRAHQAPQLKAVVERTGARFLYHDGGIENSMATLPGLLSRADFALFPVDCVSHDAMVCVKRLCRQSGKPFIALRTSSLTALLSALSSIRQTVPAATPV